MKDRNYYHDTCIGKVPDVESMVAFLLDEGVLYLGGICLYVNCGDYFIPAADGEDIRSKDVERLFEFYKTKSWDGVYEFVAAKRGIENKHWRSKGDKIGWMAGGLKSIIDEDVIIKGKYIA